MDEFMEMLIHTLKANRYRFKKALAGAEKNFGDFKLSEQTRSSKEVINHMVDLANKTRQMITTGNFDCPSPALLTLSEEVERFLVCLDELEAVMHTRVIEINTAKRLLQGPILDMTTHIGQLAMLNGLHGNKVPKESYYNAEI